MQAKASAWRNKDAQQGEGRKQHLVDKNKEEFHKLHDQLMAKLGKAPPRPPRSRNIILDALQAAEDAVKLQETNVAACGAQVRDGTKTEDSLERSKNHLKNVQGKRQDLREELDLAEALQLASPPPEVPYPHGHQTIFRNLLSPSLAPKMAGSTAQQHAMPVGISGFAQSQVSHPPSGNGYADNADSPLEDIPFHEFRIEDAQISALVPTGPMLPLEQHDNISLPCLCDCHREICEEGYRCNQCYTLVCRLPIEYPFQYCQAALTPSTTILDADFPRYPSIRFQAQ